MYMWNIIDIRICISMDMFKENLIKRQNPCSDMVTAARGGVEHSSSLAFAKRLVGSFNTGLIIFTPEVRCL